MSTKSKRPSRTATVATRVAPELKKKLQALAKDVDRSEAYIVAEAIADYVEMTERQVREIRQRLARAKAGEPGVAHEDVEKWVRSFGTKRELHMPKARS
jgi:predicted transcriptional regulator